MLLHHFSMPQKKLWGSLKGFLATFFVRFHTIFGDEDTIFGDVDFTKPNSPADVFQDYKQWDRYVFQNVCKKNFEYDFPKMI